MIKKAIIEALREFFSSEDGRALIVKAVKTAMIYEIELETHNRDDTIEKIKTKHDILAHIAGWITRSEGAIRGCQQDVQKISNRIFNPKDKFLIIEKEKYKQIIDGD